MKRIAILLSAAALSGCGYAQALQERAAIVVHNITTSPAQLRAERDATDDATCKSYGAMAATPAYIQCRTGLTQARAARAAAADAAADAAAVRASQPPPLR